MHALETVHPDPEVAPQVRRFEALYRGEFAFVCSAARHLGVPSGAIDDVVQDVFLTAYRRLDHLRFEVSPRAWLFGVTRRVAFRYRRGAARRVRRHSALAEVGPVLVEAPQQRHDDAQQLGHLLARLSPVTREVWQMTELLGMSAPEIASELGLPLNTVYSRLRLAREQLKALVAEATIEAWRDEARRRGEPGTQARQRTWAVLLPAFGDRGSGVGLLAWMKTQAAMTTTLIATGVVALGLAVRPLAPVSSAPAAAVAQADPAPASRAGAPVTAAQASVQPVYEAASDTAAGPERRLSSRTAPLQTAQARLAEEVALIDLVHARLAAGDTEAALTTISTHARRFPGGVLADVREAVHVDVLCRRGEAAVAEAVARRLVVDHPVSAVAQRFANYVCPR